MKKLEICISCPSFVGTTADDGECALITSGCCSGDEIPAGDSRRRIEWRRRLHEDGGLCPAGRWPSPPPPPGWVHARAAACMGCENHLGAYRCAAYNGSQVGKLVLNAAASCPATPPRWSVVNG